MYFIPSHIVLLQSNLLEYSDNFFEVTSNATRLFCKVMCYLVSFS